MKVMTQELVYSLGWRPTGDLGPFTFYTKADGTVVFFPKAPPTKPPTPSQLHCRNVFRQIAFTWNACTEQQRRDWAEVVRRAHLPITGYDLFTHCFFCFKFETIKVLERRTGINLLPLHTSTKAP